MSTTTSTPTTTSSPTSTSASCVTMTPGKYGYVPPEACNGYYNFYPQFAPAVATATIFGLFTVAHIALAVLYKKRYAWVLIMGSLWETIAFILHSLGSHNQQNLGYASSYIIIFLLAPLWINAFVYMTLARTVFFFKPDRRVWVVRAVSMSKYFVWADVVTFIIQAIGGVMETPDSGATQIKIGLDIYMAGLGLQEFCILVFAGLIVKFHRDCLAMENLEKWGGSSDKVQPMEPGRRGWRRVVFPMYAVLFFITVRIAYRIAEFGGGVSESNPLPYHEAYSYALDAFPMMICLLLLALWHPGRVLLGPEAQLPRKTRAEKKAEKLEKKQAKAQRKAEITQGTDGSLFDSQRTADSQSAKLQGLRAPDLSRPELPAPTASVPRRTEPQVWGTYTEFDV
ncbi:rta1 domain protein [Ophiostoma piceae UAMH 11346]|uniref:Rta1 domain protein n=1 Tax=Ophiostoma piceae (strain UAMH 11346) TaxID=1262450 RepID=S3C2H3_OPHP1|nr:rta1 domain protein [Ophiostoma piceae UAMH 11346]